MKITPENKVIIQGITEKNGLIYSERMKEYGTNIVAGISYNGEEKTEIPIFDLVEQVIEKEGKIDTSIIFASPYKALDVTREAIAAGINQIILITRDIPPLDMVNLLRIAENSKTLLLGPGNAGIIIPGKCLLGTYETQFYTAGNVGIISRSRSLNYEVAITLTNAGIGQSISVNLGNGSLIGSSFCQWLEILAEDKNTKAIVLIGQNGSGDEEEAALIAAKIDKPVIVYIAGSHAKSKNKMTDYMMISAYLTGKIEDLGTTQRKINAFKQVKIPVAEKISEIPILLKKYQK